MLYAFGYADLADALEQPIAALVELVTSGRLDPLDLHTLALQRVGGPAALLERQPFVRETRLVVPSHLLERRTYGLGDAWAFGYADLARFGDCTINAVRIAAASHALDPRSLAAVLDYLAGRGGRRRGAA